MKTFYELEVWQKAHQLTLDVHRATVSFPVEERFGLVSQLRRSAASVPANIAEGFGRGTTKDFLRFLDISGGSLNETRYFLLLSRDLGHLSHEQHKRLDEQCDEVGRLLGGLVRSLRKRLP